MLKRVVSAAVLVWDAKKAAEWYRDKLGFEVSEQGHWVEVKPPGSTFVLHLCANCPEWGDDKPGGHTGILFETDDKEETYHELKSKGVVFDVELTEAPWGGGKYAIFKDLYGNMFWM